MRHFSQALPEGTDRNDVASLLVHVADTIRKNKITNIRDICLNDSDSPKEPPSLAVYFEDDHFGYEASSVVLTGNTIGGLLEQVSAKLRAIKDDDITDVVLDTDGRTKEARIYY